jgi:hypothetical protein
MTAETKSSYGETLPLGLQWLGFATLIALIALLALGAWILVRLADATTPGPADAPIGEVLRWALAAGFVGGAGRALFRFIWELGGCGDHLPSVYVKRWYLYLAKPAMGAAGGLFFFLAVNLGLVAALSDGKSTLQFPQVCLTAALGGIFFEDVFAVLADLMPKSRGAKDKTPPDPS